MTVAAAKRETWDFERQVGETYWFEYHCEESLKSSDAAIWLRSHERVTVVGEDLQGDGSSVNWPDSTFIERNEGCCPRVFRARWSDGFEWDVFEDELLITSADFCRPDPPKDLKLPA